ncbi:FAD-dependent monooxygenase [Nocardioides zeae]
MVVVGFGPTGATAANLLGRLGVRTLVVERDLDVFPRQRAIAADEDALRVWQGVGLLEELLVDMETDIRVHFENAGHRFLSFEASRGKGQGVPGTVFFHQPSLESTLRRGVQRFPHVAVASGTTVVGVDQDEDGVTVRATDQEGRSRTWRARYVVAADGGSSAVRKLLDIGLPGRHITEQWYDVQVEAAEPHVPGTPLDFVFLADPRRPGVDCPCPGGYHRFEFMVRPDEDVEEIASEAGMARVLAERGVDLASLQVYRHWAYTFHVRQAERWREGRVFLAGDAAHIMPPFAGQGVSSGVRDVANLCWKLAGVLAGAPGPDALLDSYDAERRPNVLVHTRVSLRIGSIVMSRDPVVVRVRDTIGALVMRTPLLGRWVTRHPLKPAWSVRADRGAPHRAHLAPGRHGRSATGHLLTQPELRAVDGTTTRLDLLTGDGWSWVCVEDTPVPAVVSAAGIPVVRVVFDAGRQRPGHHLDTSGLLERQLRRSGARGFLVRPDRFVYGTDRDDLAGACVRVAPAGAAAR